MWKFGKNGGTGQGRTSGNRVLALAPVLALGAGLATGWAGAAQAGPYEVIHPDIQAGGFELEWLNSVVVSKVHHGDELSEHEIGLSYAPFWFWKPKLGLEIENKRGKSAELEAFVFENVFLLPIGRNAAGARHAHGHGHSHSHAHDHGDGFALGLYAALEIPNEGGMAEAEASLGPIAEFALGPVDTIANLFVDIPFKNGKETGISYALAASTPVSPQFALGAEAHGKVKEAFGNRPSFNQQEHVLGPAVYSRFDLGGNRIIEPRLAMLFGLTDAAPDAVLSFNIELKF